MAKRSKEMAETEGVERSWWEAAGIDLDQVSDQDIMDLVKEALERLTPVRLTEVIDAVEARRRSKEAEVKEALLTEFRERAMEVGLSFDALFGARRTRNDAGQPLAPKYRGPNGETWSGRGRQPNWLTALESTGHNKEEFLVKEEEEAA